MSDSNSISVVIPVFNCERYLGEAIESVLAQTLSPDEIIVVDDGSTDRSGEIAKSFAPRVRYEFRPHAGIPKTRNHCIAVARGDWVAFLDADDLWMPEKLRAQADLMLARPELQFTLTHVLFFLEPGSSKPVGCRLEWFEKGQPAHLLSSFLGRKIVFNSVGQFDPTLPISEDLEWFARAKDLGVPMALIDETLVRKRVHDFNICRPTEKNKMLLLQAMKRSLDRKRHV